MTGEEDRKLKKLDIEAKVEDNNNNVNTKSPSSSRQWSMFKNPRIVRVSRAFGGKDRHSKVTTIKGLKDRRIRLSVPTAIQLYDLQDRLGLSQPSKVVDWLLDATKDEIDKLPPLQMAPGIFNNFNNSNLNLDSTALKTTFSPFFNTNLSFFKDEASQSSMTSKDGIRENSNFGDDMMGKSKAWDLGSSQENQDGNNYNPQVSAQNFFPISSHSLFPNLLNNSIPYNSYYHMETEPNSNLSLSQFENHEFQNHIGGNSSHLQALQPSGSHLYLYPTAPTPSIFPQHPSYFGASSENDARHVNMFLPNPFMPSLHIRSQDDENELDKSSSDP